jgi:hypothetical protein
MSRLLIPVRVDASDAALADLAARAGATTVCPRGTSTSNYFSIDLAAVTVSRDGAVG